MEALRLAVSTKKLIARFRLRPDVFVLPLAAVIGVVTAGLPVAFQELIHFIRDQLCLQAGPELLYGRALAGGCHGRFGSAYGTYYITDRLSGRIMRHTLRTDSYQLGSTSRHVCEAMIIRFRRVP